MNPDEPVYAKQITAANEHIQRDREALARMNEVARRNQSRSIRMSIFTLAFWRAAFERSTKSAAQGGILAFGAGQANVLDLDWGVFFGFAGGAFLLSLLTSIGSDALTGGTGPSLTNAEVVTDNPDAIGKAVGDAINKGVTDGRRERGEIGLLGIVVVALLVLVLLFAVGVLR